METAVSMQHWLDNAQNSSDARDRIAVAGGISRGVFGSLHLGVSENSGLEAAEATQVDESFEEFKRAA